MRQQVVRVVKDQPVLCVAMIAMLVTCVLVPVDGKYLDYFNMQTLATLFCTLAVVSAFSHIHVFEILSKSIILMNSFRGYRIPSRRNCALSVSFSQKKWAEFLLSCLKKTVPFPWRLRQKRMIFITMKSPAVFW